MTLVNAPVYLWRIDADRSMTRFYSLAVEVDLLGDVVSIRPTI